MADKRISDLPAATQWHPDAFIPQDNPAGLTEKVTPAQVETKLEADGFIKAASPSLGQVAAYTAGGWAPIKLADANIDAAAAIGWGKISKSGAVATDVGALPTANPTATGTLTAPDVIGGLARMQASAVSPSNQAWFGYTGLNSAGAYVGYYPGSDGAVRIAAASGKTVSIGTGAAYGQLVISDSGVASSSLAGTGTRAVAADSTGKLVDASTGLSGSGTMAAMINGSGQIERSTNLKDNGPGGMEFIRPPIMPAPINNAPNLRLAPGSDPTTLTDGDLWFDGASLKIRIGGVTRTVTVT